MSAEGSYPEITGTTKDRNACKCMCSEGHNVRGNCHEARLSDNVGIYFSYMLGSPEKELYR